MVQAVFANKGELHMNIKLQNTAKIIEADIGLDGISVISGLNNTGKSTILKTIYMTINLYRNATSKIMKERKRSLQNIVRNNESYFDEKGYDYLPTNLLIELSSVLCDSINALAEQEDCYESLKKLFHQVLAHYAERVENKYIYSDEFLLPIYDKVKEVIKRPKEDYLKYIGDMYLRNNFHNQVNCLQNKNKAYIEISSSYGNNHISILDNKIAEMSYSSINEPDAIYLPALNTLDFINRSVFFRGNISYSPDYDLKKYILSEMDEDLTFEDYSEINENVNIIKEIINEVVHGKLETNDNGVILFKDNELEDDIDLGNIASGMKNFLIIQKLVQNGSLKKNSVLLIDEPETNLHPEWHLKFAEILVLMYKNMGVKAVVNSHSPYFIRALEVKMADHGIKSQAKYYMMQEMEKNRFVSKDVSGETNKIYEKLYQPLEYL